MEFLRIFYEFLWGQEINSWRSNHEPLIPTLTIPC